MIESYSDSYMWIRTYESYTWRFIMYNRFFFQCETDAFSFLLTYNALGRTEQVISVQIIYDCTSAPSGKKTAMISYYYYISQSWGLTGLSRQMVAGIAVISKLRHSHGSWWLILAGAGAQLGMSVRTPHVASAWALGFFPAWRQGFKSTCTKTGRTPGICKLVMI